MQIAYNTAYYIICNLCSPFKHDIRCASLCGVEFVVTKERREKRAQRESCLKGVRSLLRKLIRRLKKDGSKLLK